ncbi:MAG: MoxR family ATPase [Bacteroidales bacterium]|nr:MoxR family ATPase [Bacteroidales bacterium]
MNQTADNIKELNERINRESAFIDMVNREMAKVIVGQKQLTEGLLIGLLSNGHVLLEGVPGLAKTLAIKTLSQIIKSKFNRIQFTPDLLPADLLGTMIYSQKSEEFVVKKGPVFANFILADEINRSPAKVQSALLEAMQEHQVTIGEETYKLDDPFLVLATQNPIEQEGTYPLPEAQVDRFMLKIIVNYPKKDEEKLIIRQNITGEFPKPEQILTSDDIIKARELVKEVYIDERIENYIVDIVSATRNPELYGLEKFKELISYGGSPRAGISLAKASKAYAFIKRRGYVFPEDVRSICHAVLRHRIGLTYEAEAQNITTEEIISEILNTIPVP